MKRVRFAERRKTVGLSQESLAEAVGVDRSTIVRWERGERAPQSLPRMPDSTVSRDAVGGHLTVVVCAAGPASDVAVVIRAAHAAGWTVNVIATPAAVPFLDVQGVEELTNAPVRIEPRDPDTPRDKSSQPPSAILVAPATFNTINKLAAGIADNYALTILAEAIGAATPVVIVPLVNAALAARMAYRQSLNTLRQEGVRIVEGEGDNWTPHPPGTGDAKQGEFPWERGFGAVAAAWPRAF